VTKPACRPASVARMRSNGILAPLILCLAACAFACGHPPPPRSRPADTLEAPPTPPPLPPAPAAKPADQRELRLTLPAGAYVRLAIVSTPMDLAVRQAGPEGRQLEMVQLAGGTAEPTRLSWVVTAAGEYRWTVEPRGPQGLIGSAAIALEEERPAGPCDEARLRVERAVVGARWEMSRPGDVGPEGTRAMTLLQPIQAAATEVGEQEGDLAVLLGRAAARRREGAVEASDLLRTALGMTRALGDRRAEADAMEEFAQLLPTAQAITSLQSVREIRQQLRDESGQASVLQLMGYYYNESGDPVLALQAYQKALALQWRTEDFHDQPWTMGELGVLFVNRGDPDRARDYLDLAAQRGQEANDPHAQAFALIANARLNIDLGELQAAHDQYSRAKELLALEGTTIMSAWALEGLSRVLLYFGEPDRARQMYGEALRDFGTLRVYTGTANALLGIGWAFEREGQPQKALETFQDALKVIRAHDLSRMEGLVLYDLGLVHRELNLPLQAIAELEAVIARETGNPVRQAQANVELAHAYRDAGRKEEAETAFQQAVQLSATAPVVQAAAQAGLAISLRDRGDLGGARYAIERALEITETLRSGVIRPDQRISFLSTRRAYYEFYVDLLVRLNQLYPGSGHDGEAVAASERARARGLLDLLTKEKIDVHQGIPPALKQREIEIGTRIAALQQRLLSSVDLMLPPAEIRRIERELSQADEEEKDLDAEVRRHQPAYAMRVPRPLPLLDIQNMLDERTALLEFFLGEDSSYLFVITHRGLAIHPLPPKHKLADLVDRVRSAIYQESHVRSRHFAQDSFDLYRVLIQPAAGEILGKVHLIVAPDAFLYSLSFEVLLTRPAAGIELSEGHLPYLVRDWSISYVPSASVLAQLLAQHQPRGQSWSGEKLFVGFGDPDEGSVPTGGIVNSSADVGCPDASTSARSHGELTSGVERSRSLPGARDELCRIADLFPSDQAVVFTGPAAMEETVKTSSLVKSARILHFASHALLDEKQPELSGLRLAPSGSAINDGLLQVREIFNLELRAELVVLSACQTGLGKEVSGEGMIGMTHAFLYAGAGSIVVSLWKVDDQATADLMVSFYRYLQQNGKSEALRRAKLDLIDRSRYSNPYFWAAFTLVGLPQ